MTHSSSPSPSSEDQSSRSASPWITSTPAGSTRVRSTGTRWRSSSIAVTEAPVSARASVSEPSPAPISTTRSPGPTWAKRAMRRTVLGSATKFWPRARLGRMPWLERSRTTWLLVSVTSYQLPGDADVDDAGGRRRQPLERLLVEIDDATADIGTPVGDPARHRQAIGQVGDGDDGALGQGLVGTGAVVGLVVGRLAGLLVGRRRRGGRLGLGRGGGRRRLGLRPGRRGRRSADGGRRSAGRHRIGGRDRFRGRRVDREGDEGPRFGAAGPRVAEQRG